VDLYNDWELTHEMIHFGFPSVDDRHRWIEEGIATYVEPIARASVGILTCEQVWADMLRDMSQGLPQAGDRGLDQTHTWGRTYWGGALFCLLADVEIRRRTGNSKGLRDALRAINRAGGTIDADWYLERAFEIGDKATDGGTLMELYGQMASTPVTPDLPHLWAQLGVVSEANGIALDDHAPWAAIRSGICQVTRR
jgi:predicted metalloprotease with PDZ domain